MTYSTTADGSGMTAPTTDDKAIGLVNYVLLLLGFFTSGITSVVAVVLAYVRREQAEPFARSHYGFQISTFWIGFIGSLIGVALMLASIAPFIMAGLEDGGDFSGARAPELAFGGVALLTVGGLVLLAANVAALVRSLYGLAKLASDSPMRG